LTTRVERLEEVMEIYKDWIADIEMLDVTLLRVQGDRQEVVEVDPEFDFLYEVKSSAYNDRHNAYIGAWNYYVRSCKAAREKIRITFDDYERMQTLEDAEKLDKWRDEEFGK